MATSIVKIIPKPPITQTPYDIFNIGNSSPVPLKKFIKEIELNLKIKCKIDLLPLQKGDIPNTNSNSKKLFKKIKYKPKTNFKEGIKKFISWYLKYYKK